MRRVCVVAPATIANLGPGFDAIGLALESPADRATAERRPEPGIEFRLDDPTGAVPRDQARNVAAHVAAALLADARPEFGVRLTLHKRMPVGSGLGSSAASAVAALVAVNALLSKPRARADLLRFAVEGERLASGAPHADNVAACLLGGVQIVLSGDPPVVVPVPFVDRIRWVVVHPATVIETRTARRRLPGRLDLADAVSQWAHVGALVAGLATGNAATVGNALVDRVAEPARAPLIPGFLAVRQAALLAGAFGMSISGSGPSVFAVTDSDAVARRVARAMVRAFRTAGGIGARAWVSRINRRGARIQRLPPLQLR
ncbi:MAG: homoserine kinase [Candidatus Eisenbacteria bacterium]|nr:homoserine kinase [Candidatus Eisenbacteria bacterium]